MNEDKPCHVSESSVSIDADYENRCNLLDINKKSNQQGSQMKTPMKIVKNLSLNKSIYNIEITSASKPPTGLSARSLNSARSHLQKHNITKTASVVNPAGIQEDFKLSTAFLIRKQMCFSHTSRFKDDKSMAQYLYLNHFSFFCFMHFPKVSRRMSSRMNFNNLDLVNK